jgi:hypothetical protein
MICNKTIFNKTIFNNTYPESVLKNHIIFCQINKNKLNQMIHHIFVDVCNVSVYGYNSHLGEYWGKKVVINKNPLHFNFSINYYNENSSIIIISPIYGDTCDITELIKKITGVLEKNDS